MQDMHRDLMDCFVWKQVALGFFSMASSQAGGARNTITEVVPGST
jgi:hypothetical protein